MPPTAFSEELCSRDIIQIADSRDNILGWQESTAGAVTTMSQGGPHRPSPPINSAQASLFDNHEHYHLTENPGIVNGSSEHGGPLYFDLSHQTHHLGNIGGMVRPSFEDSANYKLVGPVVPVNDVRSDGGGAWASSMSEFSLGSRYGSFSPQSPSGAQNSTPALGTATAPTASGVVHLTAENRHAYACSKFTRSLFEMTSLPENADGIGFSSDGVYLEVRNSKPMEERILSRYFRHKNLGSFIRQLNNYGFKTMAPLDPTSTIQSFYHEFFRAGRPDLLSLIVRKTQRVATENIESVPIEPGEMTSWNAELRRLRQRESEYLQMLRQLEETNQQIMQENNQLLEENARLRANWTLLTSSAGGASPPYQNSSGASSNPRSLPAAPYSMHSSQSASSHQLRQSSHSPNLPIGLNILPIPDSSSGLPRNTASSHRAYYPATDGFSQSHVSPQGFDNEQWAYIPYPPVGGPLGSYDGQVAYPDVPSQANDHQKQKATERKRSSTKVDFAGSSQASKSSKH